MSKLPRPNPGVWVRVQVAVRQLKELDRGWSDFELWTLQRTGWSGKKILDYFLSELFPNGEKYHLHHDPALENRKKVYRNGVHVDYDPPANDPNGLEYIERHAHHIVTNVRGKLGQFSDNMLAKRNRKIAKRRARRASGKGYRWPKGRKIQNRKVAGPKRRCHT